jgi:hypothetical protein
VVIGHLTKSIAQYAPKLSGVTNDHITKTVIPSSICIYLDICVQSMTTYIWCKDCHKLINKEMLHEDCEPRVPVTPENVKQSMGLSNSAYSADAHKPNQTTIEALEEALDER